MIGPNDGDEDVGSEDEGDESAEESMFSKAFGDTADTVYTEALDKLHEATVHLAASRVRDALIATHKALQAQNALAALHNSVAKK